MHASLLITDAAAVLQGIPLVSAMKLAYVQLAFISAATQGGLRVNNLFNSQAVGHADSFRTGGQDRNFKTKKATELEWLQAHAQNLLSSWRGFGTVVTMMIYECMLYMHNFSKTFDRVHWGGRGAGGSKRQDVASSTHASNAITATSVSSRGKEKKKAEGVSSSSGKRRRESEQEEEVLMEGQEGAFKTPRQGEGNHQDAVATESTPDQPDVEIDDEKQNKRACLARFCKRSQASKRNELIHDMMPCKDVLLPDVFMSTTWKLEVQVLDTWTIVILSKWINQHFLWCASLEYAEEPSQSNQNSCKAAMDLDRVPWKQLCKTYGLTLLEVAPLQMNAEGQPVELLDVWLMNESNKVRYRYSSL